MRFVLPNGNYTNPDRNRRHKSFLQYRLVQQLARRQEAEKVWKANIARQRRELGAMVVILFAAGLIGWAFIILW